MQKRLLALVATVAMVLSMFAGIAFADTQTLAEAKAAVEAKLDQFVATNDTTEAQLAAAVEDVVTNSEITVTIENFEKTVATTSAAGSITGTVKLALDPDVEEVAINLEIAKLTAHKYSVQLGTKKFISSGETPGFRQIVGTITGEKGTDPSELLKNFVIKYTYKDNKGDTLSGTDVTVTNGQFSFYVRTDIPAQDITLTVYQENGTTKLQSEGKDVTAKLEVSYNVTTTPTELKFAKNEPIVVSGKVTDSNGNPVKGKSVSLSLPVTNPALPADLKTSDTGEFAFVVFNWTAPGEYQLQINGMDHKKVTVAHAEAKLTVIPNTGVVHTIAPVEFEVKGSGFMAGTLKVELKKGNTIILDDEWSGWDKIKGAVTTDGAFESTFTWTPESAGTYTLVVTRGDYKASATISVTNPVSYNLINGSKLEELNVGPNSRDFGVGDSKIHLVQYKADGTTDKNFFYTVYVDGKLAKDTVTDADFVKLASGTVNFKAAKLGTKTIKVVAYKTNDANAKAVFEKTFTAKVVGWDVTLEPAELTVKQAKDVVVVVKDDEGQAINNATIELVDVKTLEAGSTNVQNGTYTLKDIKINTPGTVKVKVWKGKAVTGTLMAELDLEVVGEKVYNVTANVDTLLQGKGEDVELTVTRDGVAVIPQRIKWVYKDGTSDEAYPTYLGDGVSEVNIKATKAGNLVVRVENFDGTLCGETTIEVVAPQLVLIDEEAANVTENFKSAVNFKVVDPRNGEAITANLAISSKWADIEVYDANGGIIVPDSEGVVHVLGDDEYTLTILATDAKFDDAEDEEEVVAVELKVNEALVDGHFEVKEATITSDPEMIVIGAKNNLTLTYLDANGKPIVGKAVKVENGADLGKTDDNGQVIYPAGIVAQAVKIVAATDVTGQSVEKTIKIGYDFEAPQVTYEVDGNKATLIITDNVRLVRINIDGKDIDFWPGARYEHVVTLNPGVNKVRVKAQDSNDNVLDEVVEIEYKTESVVLEGDKVQRQGDYTFVQARQFKELGAKFAWDNASKTATFTVGDTTVEVTIGSTTAKINGEAVTMPAAPYISNDRTYIPVRFVSESLGWGVHWVPGDIITITL